MSSEKRQRFAIRKFTVGVASVVVGQFFIGPMQTPVRANEVTEATVTSVTEIPKKEIGNLETQVAPQPKEESVPSTNVEQPVIHETKPKAEVEPTNSTVPSINPEVHEKSELDVTALKETANTVEEKTTTSTNGKVEKSVKDTKEEKFKDKTEKESEENLKKEDKKAEEKKTAEEKELEELKIRYSNTLVEIKAIGTEAEQLLKKVDPNKLSKASLQAAYQLAKQEETAAQALLAKEKLTKAELRLALERLEAVVERLYSELKANGHSGDVSYRLDASTVNNDAPYMTIERYFGTETGRNNPDYKFKKDGSTVELKYKMGLTNITSDEVELTPDAQKLGFHYNDGGKDDRYLIKTVTLDNTIQSGTYIIGLQSKKDPKINITAKLTIEEPPLYKVVEDYSASLYSFDEGTYKAMNNPMGDSVTYDERSSTAYMTSTPFGYYLHSPNSKTIADAKPNSPQYTSNLWLSLPGREEEYNIIGNKAPITITKFQQTGGSSGVTVEFITDTTPTAKNVFVNDSTSVSDALTGGKTAGFSTSSTSISYNVTDKTLSPYRINFKTLPDKAGTYFVDFQITDSIGRVTNYHLNLVTREISQTTPSGYWDSSGNYTLTNADVMFNADKLYRVTNPIPVAVPISDKEQNLGDLVLNKANASLTIDSKPDGVEITKDTDNPTKFKIIKQNGHTLAAGVYTITATAKDGHFGANVPSRTYKFEVMDGLNAIGHQTWTEGQAIPNIPISMTNGSKITSLSVETGGDYIHLTSNADHTGVTGYALKKTDGIKTAYVTATYTNNEGQSRQIKTKFTYEVMPSPVTDLSLEISNNKQTVSEGTKFKDMAVTATEGAKITVGTLPAGVSYDAEHKILSGVGQYEGHHIIPVTVTKNGASITKLVELTVTPGNFNVPTANYTFTAGNEIAPITLNIPSNATVSSVGGDLPRGLSWSADRKTITGTPTQVGTFRVYGYVNRTTADGTNQSTYAYINITVNSVPLNFSIPDNTKTVKALDELPPIHLQADGAVLSITSGSLPPGVNYDAATKTVSGTPAKVGTYTATFTATSSTISGNSTASATLTINVTPRNLTVDVKNKEQEKNVLTPIDNVVLTLSDNKARLEVDTSQLPPGVTYDAASRTISGKPSKVGEYLIPYKATFPEMAESPVEGGHIKINVRPLPVSINVTEKEQTVRAGTAIKNMVVTHSEHSNLGARYLSVDLPEGDIDSYLESIAGLNYNAATHTITGTPTKPGVYRIRLKASIDSPNLGKGSAEEIITLTVVDDPVSLDIKNDRQMIALGKTSLRPITFTVPADATLTFDETKLPAGVTYDKASKTISGTPTAVGAFDIPVTVTSAGGKSITKDITIDVVDLTPPTPTVTVKENNDGTHTITISQPNGQPVETIIKNGKDGETPKVKVDRDETKKETTLTFYSDKNANNQFDEDTDTVLGTSVIKDGQDGVAGAKGEKGDAGENGRDGKDGFTPIVSVVTNSDGSHTISITQPDGKEPITTTVKNGENGKDGRSPRVELKPIYPAQPRSARRARSVDEDRATTQPTAKPIGVHITVYYDNDNSLTYTAGDTLISEEDIYNGVDGRDGRDGIDGKSAIIETRENSDGSHTFIITNADGTKREIVVKDGQDGKSSTIETKENSDGSRTIIITNPDGTKQEFVVKNGKDGRDGKDGTCNCNVNPTPVQPGTPGTTPSEQPKPESGSITSPSDKPVKPELKPDPKPETNKPNTPNTGGNSETPGGNTPERQTPPMNGNVPPVYKEPTVERDPQPNETNSTPLANTSTGTPIEEVNEETPIVTVTTTGVNISNGRLPETGTKYDTIYIVLGSGILLSLYMGKRKEESSNEME